MNNRELLIFVPVLGVLSFALYGVGSVARENRNTFSCQSNLKQIGLGLRQYIRDYDEKIMLANNWETAIYPWLKNSQILDCPSGNFNYALNRHVSGVSEERISDTRGTPAVFDSTSTQPNASDFGTSWPKDGAHSIWKRGRGTNVAFFDGHVEWMQQKPAFLAIPKPLPPIYRFLKPQQANKLPPARNAKGRVIVKIQTR